MSDRKLNIAVILSATDKMSGVINKSVSDSQKRLEALSKRSSELMNFGARSTAAGAIAAAPIIAMAKEFGDQEAALNQMKAEMLKDGGGLDQKMFTRLTNYAKKSTELYGGTAEAYIDMMRVLRENSVDPKDTLGGIGEAVEQLSVAFEMQPGKIAQFAARMRQDMGITAKEMTGMMDLIARLKNAGIAGTGKEAGVKAVEEMSEAFSKAGLGATNLGVTGLQQAKDLGALMGIFIRRGISGSTVGNNFRRIFDGLRSAEKLDKANAEARKFGITLDFYDKNHKFKGIANFTGELNKLKGLNTQQVSKILNPFSGKQGLSTDFLEFLANDGLAQFNHFQDKLASQGTLQQKVAVIMGGLNKQYDVMHANMVNALADIGSDYAPELKELLKTVNAVIKRIVKFTQEHKTLTKIIALGVLTFAALAVTIGTVSMAVGVVMKTIAGVGKIAILFSDLAVATSILDFKLALLGTSLLEVTVILAALAAIGYIVYKTFFTKDWDENYKTGWLKLVGQINGVIAVMKALGDVAAGVGKIIFSTFTFDKKGFVAAAAQTAEALNLFRSKGVSGIYADGRDKYLRANNAHIVDDGKNPFGHVERYAGGAAVPVKPQNKGVMPTMPMVFNFNGVNPNDPKAVAESVESAVSRLLKKHTEQNNRLNYGF